jgi:thymidylate kinase
VIILLDGLNCTGKSTLAENLRQHLEIPVIKFSVPGDDVYGEFRERLTGAMTHNRHFIIDRLHLSNYAYNGRQGGSVLVENEWNVIDQMIAKEPSFLYWMLDTPHAIEARLRLREGREDGAEAFDRGVLAEIHNRFRQGFVNSAITNKGSYTLRQFVGEDGLVTAHFSEHLRLHRAVMAGVAF